jgi:hypothetical protein
MSEQVIIGADGSLSIVPAGPIGPPGPDGPLAPESQMANAATLAARPDPETVRAGYTFWASDAKTLWVKEGPLGSGSWTEITPKGNEILEIVAPATLGSTVTLTATATPYQLPGFVSSVHTYTGAPIRVSFANLLVTGSSTTSSALNAVIAYQKNGGSTWYLVGAGLQRSFDNLTMLGMGYVTAFDNAEAMVPAATQTLTPGDTFQVGVLVYRNGGTSGTVRTFVAEALAAFPVLVVERLRLA